MSSQTDTSYQPSSSGGESTFETSTHQSQDSTHQSQDSTHQSQDSTHQSQESTLFEGSIIHRDALQEARLTFLESLLPASRTREAVDKLLQYREPATRRNWCLETNLVATKQGGYAQVSVGGVKLLTINQLVAWETCAEGGHSFIAERPQASHLCGNAWCIQKRHILWEAASANNLRKGCIPTVLLEGRKVVRLCRHSPPCVKPLATLEQSDLYEERGGVLEFREVLADGYMWAPIVAIAS